MVCITYVISCYFGSNTSSCILLHHIASSCIAFHRLASSCNVLHYLASSCIVLQRLAASSHHVTNIQIRSQKQLMSKHIFGWTQPPWRVPRLSSTSCAALLQAAHSRRTLSSHHPQQPELEADELTFPTKNDWATPCPVKQLLGEVLPIWQPMPPPPTASDTLPPQNNNHPTTLHHVTNMQIRSQKQLMSKHIFGWTQPPWRVPRLSSTSCAALLQAAKSRRTLSSHHPQQPELEADELTFPTKNDWATPCPVKQLLGEVLPIWQPMPRPPTASDTLPPQNNNHPTTLHHVTNMQIRSQKQLMSKHIFGWTQPPWRVPRLSSTSCAALLQAANSRRNVSSHHPQQPELEADELTFPTKNDWATPCPVKQLLGEVLPIWQPMPRPPTASDTLPPQNNNHPTTLHHVTNMQLSSQSYSAPPDLHAWCQDIQQSSAQLSNRRPLIVRSTANIPSLCHFAKLHYRNFCQGILEPFTTPGHSTATQLLQPNFHGIGRRGWRGRVLHSHGHSLQQMKQRPQNVHKRHGCVTSTKHFAFRNSETCIFVRLLSKQCHDMLDFKTKLNGTKLNGTMIPVIFFCPLLMHFNENITYIFFRVIHHIDPLHRKQTQTLSQCNLEKCKKC